MEILRCLLLPIYGKTFIVPYAAVCEVVVLPSKSMSFSKSKSWVLGEFPWRGLNIPLLNLGKDDEALPNPAFDRKAKEDAKANLDVNAAEENVHIAVINRMIEGNYPDFIGLLLQTVPTIHRYKRSDLEFAASGSKPYILMEVKIGEQIAFIPNIPWILEKLMTA